MAKSDYSYKIIEKSGRNCIVIQDLDKGRMSVTNDIENVVDEICQKENIFPRGYVIIYSDSNGQWDGYDYNKQEFIPLGVTDFEMAIDIYIRIQIY